ncbi:30S ribosomal protein S6 [Mycoplasmopsis gallinacea]|uniref:Small ribosomal subunit protein bS6 n=1 Tax=Mycoplasmopsis gallinacea TaxID=29556 RepID=A0A449A2A8_9BACT|nr:30S ribosomal protein S6 [Mycoplasmopsis gallinacea]QIW62537.1 30S ribosomal protein S6 [Mycoplasmopsis gallinacea]VEU58395.1 30S ribosomal protein S6 [Mycoplasmopsis gallinacea]
MTKYEIMLIVDPKADVKVAFDLLNEVFGENSVKAEKLERNELAYEINKSKHAQYVLANVETEDAKSVQELTRRSNIVKEIWRLLAINLDSEKGLNKKVKKFNKKPYFKKDGNRSVEGAKRTFNRPRKENKEESSQN